MRSFVRGLGVALLLSTGTAWPYSPSAAAEPVGAGAGIPPIEVVRELRGARIAEEGGDIAGARKILEELAKQSPDEILPLLRLVAHHARYNESDPGLPALRARLTDRLANPALPIPTGSMRYLSLEPSLDEEQLRALERRLVDRLAATEFLVDEEVELRLSLETLYDRVDDPKRQRENLARLAEIAPSFRVRWRALQIDQRLGRWAEALEGADVLAGDPSASTAVLVTRLLLLARTGQTAGLAAALEDPRYGNALQRIELLQEIAWSLEDAGESATAKSYWERIVSLDPEYTPAREAFLYLHGSIEEQQARADAVAEKWSGDDVDPSALLDQGTELLATGDVEGALDLLLRAAPSFQKSEPAWYNLGQAAYRLERWEIAADAFGKAATLNDRRVESPLNQGISLYELERFGEAIAPLERALMLDGSRYQTHYYLGGAYAAVGRNDDAALAMQRYREAQSQ